MRGQVLAASLAVFVVGSLVGCKTTPKMAWWKTSSVDAPEAEVLAHSAPALPSEIAKQVEGAAGTANQQLAGGTAAPFVPGLRTPAITSVAAAPSAYPSTEAPKFVPTTPAAVPTAPTSPTLGSIAAMPYNPNAVPPAAPTTPVAAPVNVDRYASTPTPSSSVATPETPYPSTAPSYVEQVASAQAAAQPAAVSLADRYAQATAAVVPEASAPVNNSVTSPVTPTTPTVETVADASPYRPGGTSTYPATVESPMQVATRPAAPVESTQSTSTPSISGDTSLPAPPTVPLTPRYR